MTDLARFFVQAEDGIRDKLVTGVQTCALPIYAGAKLAVGALARTARSVTLNGAVRQSAVVTCDVGGTMIAYPEAPAPHAVPGLTCAWRHDDHGVRVTAVGEIDLCTAPALRDTLLWAIRRYDGSVNVDLTRVT